MWIGDANHLVSPESASRLLTCIRDVHCKLPWPIIHKLSNSEFVLSAQLPLILQSYIRWETLLIECLSDFKIHCFTERIPAHFWLNKCDSNMVTMVIS